MRRIYKLKDAAKQNEAHRAKQVKDLKKRRRQRKALERMEGK